MIRYIDTAWLSRSFSISVRQLTKSSRIDTRIDPPLSEMQFPKIIDESSLSDEQRQKLITEKLEMSKKMKQFSRKQQEEIENISSQLYTPRNPLEEPSKADLIKQRIASIEKRLEAQKRREELHLLVLKEKQKELLKPQIRDFKRPIASFLLLAMATYMALQYMWFSFEGEENVRDKENLTRKYEEKIQQLLDEQRELVDRKEDEEKKKKKQWWLW
ncbi:hypothetical protein FOA43_004582 [Brettanomyces nanus]|uniref:Uncharacterized protein n=1 Tax=Eeniella nana TaxID=13502 RepID=A0A875S751_EENNA|nr:uncharacterized protein FOA43_004582 [Brettanomyces nanus]QPG77176.1 hypothetical protein FOA43_004582 [Brettanomyces nanus]